MGEGRLCLGGWCRVRSGLPTVVVRERNVVGKVQVKKVAARGQPSGVESEGEEPTSKILNGPVQLSNTFILWTMASVPDLAPWRMVAAVLYIHTQPPTVYIGRCLSGSESAEPLCSTREDSEGVPFANQLICKPLAVGGEFTVFQVVTGEALVASNVRVLEDGDREAGKALYMRLIGG